MGRRFEPGIRARRSAPQDGVAAHDPPLVLVEQVRFAQNFQGLAIFPRSWRTFHRELPPDGLGEPDRELEPQGDDGQVDRVIEGCTRRTT